MTEVNSQGRLARWLTIFSLALLLASVMIFVSDKLTTRPNTAPRCVGLPCFDDIDCGSFCECEQKKDAATGVCTKVN